MKVNIMNVVPTREKHDAVRSVISRAFSCCDVKAWVMVQLGICARKMRALSYQTMVNASDKRPWEQYGRRTCEQDYKLWNAFARDI